MIIQPLAALLVLCSWLAVNASQLSPFQEYCRSGKLAAVILSKTTSYEYQEGLVRAAENGHLAIVVHLQQAGRASIAQVKGRYLYDEICRIGRRGHMEVVSLFYRDPSVDRMKALEYVMGQFQDVRKRDEKDSLFRLAVFLLQEEAELLQAQIQSRRPGEDRKRALYFTRCLSKDARRCGPEAEEPLSNLEKFFQQDVRLARAPVASLDTRKASMTIAAAIIILLFYYLYSPYFNQ